MARFFATIYSGQNRGVGYRKGTIYGVVCDDGGESD